MNRMTAEVGDRVLRISADGVRPIGEVRVFSDRNAPVRRASDPSTREPHPERFARRPVFQNVAYPIVDLGLVRAAFAVLLCDNVLQGTCTVNPMYHRDPPRPVRSEIEVPAERLEPWENWFCYTDPGLKPVAFYVAIPVGPAGLRIDLPLLSESWSGRVELIGFDETDHAEVLAQSDVAKPVISAVRPDTFAASDTRTSLLSGLRAAVGYLLRSQEQSPYSGASGSAYLFYDYDSRTFRQKNWFWTLGPAIKALVGLARVPELADLAERSLCAATAMGRATVERVQRDPQHPAFGIPVTRFDTDRPGHDYEAKYSPSDALFLASWGWMPLYEATGDAHFLRASRTLVRATARLLDREAVIVQDYYEHLGSWNDWTMNEAGFGMEGIADLYSASGEPWVREAGRKYISQLTAILETTDGRWHRHFFRHDRQINPADDATRGMGWAMEGLTAAYRMGLGNEYLDKAVRMADHLLKHQREDGSWGVIYSDHSDEQPPDDKGTPLWSVLFYRMHALTGDQQYLKAAKRALLWSVSQLYAGPDPDGQGGIPTTAANGGIIYWPRYKLSCLYAVGFAAIAIEEELTRTAEA